MYHNVNLHNINCVDIVCKKITAPTVTYDVITINARDKDNNLIEIKIYGDNNINIPIQIKTVIGE